jgi:dynein heavy chain
LCCVLQHKRYLNVYKKYDDLLDNMAEKGISEFLKEKHEIEDFVTVRDAT